MEHFFLLLFFPFLFCISWKILDRKIVFYHCRPDQPMHLITINKNVNIKLHRTRPFIAVFSLKRSHINYRLPREPRVLHPEKNVHYLLRKGRFEAVFISEQRTLKFCYCVIRC